MTGAEDVLGSIESKGPQMGDICMDDSEDAMWGESSAGSLVSRNFNNNNNNRRRSRTKSIDRGKFPLSHSLSPCLHDPFVIDEMLLFASKCSQCQSQCR